jgi:hypothetical protein
MPAAIFDFINLIINLPAPTNGFLLIDVQEDMYEPWKIGVKDTGHIAPPAFDVAAGDPLPNGVLTGTYFQRNDLGWRIMPTDEDQEITIAGNLYPRDSTITKFMNRPGRTISYEFNLTANPRQVSGGGEGAGGLTAEELAMLTLIYERLDLDQSKPNNIRKDGLVIQGTNFTLTKTDNGNSYKVTRTA